MKPADLPRVSLLDDLVNRAQELADAYVRYLDRELESAAAAYKTDDRLVVDRLLSAFTYFYVAERSAITTIAADIVGDPDVSPADLDF